MVGTSRENDVAALARWCEVFVRMATKMGSFDPATSTQVLGIIAAAARRGNAKGLKGMQRDFREMLSSSPLSRTAREEIEAALEAETGLADDTAQELAAILKRGTIVTEDEARLVKSRIDEIFQDETKSAETDELIRILEESEFE
jgi:hypothetical protein